MELVLPFPARYRIELLEGPHYFGISRRFSWGQPLDPQREFVGGPAFAVWPDEGEPWIGAVDIEWGGAALSDWPQQIIGWPDERSICVVWAGRGHVIRADEPSIVREIHCDPITGLVIASERHMIVFADHDSLIAYGPDGVLWRTPRLVWCWLRILGLEGGLLRASGWEPGDTYPEFTVDLVTGKADGAPYR